MEKWRFGDVLKTGADIIDHRAGRKAGKRHGEAKAAGW
jgi:hypothetical protein